ncbi:biliverdin-producing heme oxygenase [Aurantiacibacter zhengii]|uniref:Heme oxygenase n=1 Tax=Aurantiacibacter zhengii TaxID=2307003 RepID=A0A418NTM5_9SPHN|nr:biliverdin-producing heme oxygenase [Aurantiacibacter zhengii]RIV86773.1 hypothetical protein D2V07_08785 [Aurantiacibacter zhengii]
MHGFRFRLRESTRDEHDATERAFGRFDLATPKGYGHFLLAHAGALAALEPMLHRAGWTGWTSRMGHLQADLGDLEIQAAPCPQENPPQLPTDAHVWGAQYVLEGSRLGGAVLARTIPAGSPARYLSGAESGRPGSTRPWQEFCLALDEVAKDQGEPWEDDVEQGARTTFALFRRHANIISGYDF